MKTVLLKSTIILVVLLSSAITVSIAQTNQKKTSVKALNAESAKLLADIPAADLMNQAGKSSMEDKSRNPRRKDFRIVNNKDFKNVETFPTPQDGLKLDASLKNLIEYPTSAVASGVEGVVKVMCTVDKTGNISSVIILEDIGADCAERVCSAVRKLELKPAMQNGYPRPFVMIIPVRFELI